MFDNFSKKKLKRLLVLSVILTSFASSEESLEKVITLQSTTSTENSGFYDYILPLFYRASGIRVRVVAVGTGQALKNAANGDADVLITHAKPDELKFVAEGFGLYRHDLMHNDFVFVGPKKYLSSKNQTDSLSELLRTISNEQFVFLSRGDDSGTHKKELKLWELVRLSPKDFASNWYKETGSGMGNTLNIAAALSAFTLTDRATWISYKNKSNLTIVFEDQPSLFNQYGLVLVKPRISSQEKFQNARIFCNWLLGSEGKKAINDFRKEGEQLFFANEKIASCGK
ncbi:MAG: substrate-binding domain-containing protein [Pseudomonadota bacterium]|nr:substrate-binding domain-containing protein [Pseudomonadota bacterium]